MNKYSTKVLEEFLQCQPPHLALVRAYEAPFYQKYLPFKGKILDFGCGDGFFAWSVYQRQEIDVGIDVEGSLWSEAKTRGNYKKVVVYDGAKIPFKNKEFETVVSNCVLEHIPEAENLIKEMARVTNKSGIVLVTVVTNHFGDDLMGTKLLGKFYKNWFNRKSIHNSPYSKEKWQKIFEDNGLKIIEASEYMNRPSLIAWHDISHYWGVANLITRKLLSKWVWGPSKITNRIWGQVFKLIAHAPSVETKSPYLFIAAEKY